MQDIICCQDFEIDYFMFKDFVIELNQIEIENYQIHIGINIKSIYENISQQNALNHTSS